MVAAMGIRASTKIALSLSLNTSRNIDVWKHRELLTRKVET